MVTKAIYESLKSYYNKLFRENFGQYWGFNKNDIETWHVLFIIWHIEVFNRTGCTLNICSSLQNQNIFFFKKTSANAVLINIFILGINIAIISFQTCLIKNYKNYKIHTCILSCSFKIESVSNAIIPIIT